MKSIIKWHGGKHYEAKRIADIITSAEHTHYLEPFAGSLSVLLARDPAGISEAVNDRHGNLMNFFRVVRDDLPELQRRVRMPFSRDLFDEACENLDTGTPVDRAVAFFIANRMSRQGLMRDYQTPTRRTRRGMNENVSAWLSAVDGLPELHQRLLRVEIENCDALDFIRRRDHDQALFYVDPPYVHTTRTATTAYDHEMTDDDHAVLLETLAGLNGSFVLSGYPNELYDDFASRHGWSVVDVDAHNRASSRSTKARTVERLWLSG